MVNYLRFSETELELQRQLSFITAKYGTLEVNGKICDRLYAKVEDCTGDSLNLITSTNELEFNNIRSIQEEEKKTIIYNFVFRVRPFSSTKNLE